ncbi:type II secretion system F family protein [Pseudonocardia phyllosphaerae]|uniref:type II secretion system F family protein n=1 Tax=Pseudonocardia phyllosphaerae TaxID=3390502 RepID=UPI00397CFA19
MLSVVTVRAAAALLLLGAAVFVAAGRPGAARLRGLAQAARGSRRIAPSAPLLYGGAAAAGWVVLGPGGAICAVAVTAVVRRRRAAHQEAERAGHAAAELADALTRITDELRTGAHPAAALAGTEHDGPLVRDLLAPASAAARIGEPVPDALRRAAPAGRDGAADVERVAAAWELADRHGAPLADLLAGVGDDIRWRLAHGARVRAQLAGPRATAAVLTALPLAGIGLGQLMGISPLAVLREGLLGPALLVVGVGLTGAGALWSDRILRGAVPS